MRVQDTEEYGQMLNYMQENPGKTSYTFRFPDADDEQAAQIAQAAVAVMGVIVGPIIIIRFEEAVEERS